MASDNVVLQALWFPTDDAVRRWQSWVGESNTHRRPDADETSIAERVWATGDVKRVIEEMNVNMDAVTRSAMAEVLAPWPQGRYLQALRRSGGLLNFFRPFLVGPEPVWERMVSAQLAAGRPSTDHNTAALEQAWNHTPLPILGGLTPAQVMVGVGPCEAELTWEFLVVLERECGRQDYASERQAVRTAERLLKRWLKDQGLAEGGFFELIVAERSALLARLAELTGKSP